MADENDGTVPVPTDAIEEALGALEPEAPGPEAKFDWEPLYDKLVVRRHKPKESYDPDGKIVVAETHQKAQNSGEVIAVGAGRLNLQYGTTIPLKVVPGMEVLFGKHSGIDMEDFPDLVLLREDEILGMRWTPRD